MKVRIILIILVGFLGVAVGLFVRSTLVKASSPEGGCPVAVGAPEAVYHEFWKPVSALITVYDTATTSSKVGTLNFETNAITYFDGTTDTFDADTVSGYADSDGTYDNTVMKHFPKLKVTKWEVEGHVHRQ